MQKNSEYAVNLHSAYVFTNNNLPAAHMDSVADGVDATDLDELPQDQPFSTETQSMHRCYRSKTLVFFWTSYSWSQYNTQSGLET